MRWVLILAVFLLGAVPARGEIVPMPRQKPAHAETVIPIPRQKPALDEPQVTASGWPEAEVKAAGQSCQDLLKGLDLKYSALPPLGNEGGCGAPAPILLSAVAGVKIDPPATVTCPLAKALHEWVTTSLQPAAKTDLSTQVSVIHNAASYVCRSRNGVTGAKLSEHARANALDMSGFSYGTNSDVAVADGWSGILAKIGLSPKGSFLDHVRAGACKSFTTVLGPGSDPYHGTHFHVDMIERKHGGRICQ